MECCSGRAHVNTKHKDIKLRPRVVRNISLQSDIPRIPKCKQLYAKEHTALIVYAEYIESRLALKWKTQTQRPGSMLNECDCQT